MEQAQVRQEIDDLLLPEVAATGRAVRGQAFGPELLLEDVGVRPGREQEDDVAGGGLPAVAELAYALRGRAELRRGAKERRFPCSSACP